MALQYNLKLSIILCPALFFLLRINLAIQSLLCFRMNFRMFSLVLRVMSWNFGRDCIEPVDSFFSNLAILAILILSIHEHVWSSYDFFYTL
jgi:hypothetical protein